MKIYQDAHQVITSLVRPQTDPLGLCLIPASDPWPENSMPGEDYRGRFALCQWTNYARRESTTIWLRAGKIACAPCLAAFGFRYMPEPDIYARFLIQTGYASNIDTARQQAAMMPCLPAGRYQGVLAFPLKSAPRKPDAIWIYGFPSQISHLITGWLHQTGHPVSSTFGIGLSCRAGFSEAPSVVLPGRGERIVSGTGEPEMFFALPECCLSDLVAGLNGIRAKGITAPFAGPRPYTMSLFPAMEEMARQLIKPDLK